MCGQNSVLSVVQVEEQEEGKQMPEVSDEVELWELCFIRQHSPPLIDEWLLTISKVEESTPAKCHEINQSKSELSIFTFVPDSSRRSCFYAIYRYQLSIRESITNWSGDTRHGTGFACLQFLH